MAALSLEDAHNKVVEIIAEKDGPVLMWKEMFGNVPSKTSEE